MPQLLRKDTIRLLEASVESLHLAILSLGVPQRHAPRHANARYAATVGLIGTAAELAMSACIVQVSGSKSLLQPSERFKSTPHICSDFRKLLRDAPPALGFLTQGLSDEASHRKKLFKCTEGFKRLASVRAGGFHWGLGPDRAVCGVLAQSVACFLTELSRSARVHSYIPVIPLLPEPISQVTGLAEAIATRAMAATSIEEQAQSLINLFLILPDVPEDPPEWLQALGRVAVAPKRRDVLYLLRSCSQAVPGHLRKISDAEDAIPVVVRPNAPSALPISPEQLHTSFSRQSDQLLADIATSNGRLSQRVWAIPPADTVKSMFVEGLASTTLLGPGGALTAHQAWPFVAASLAAQGTPGPYWFLVRATSDLGQLQALLKDAAELGPAFLGSNLPEIFAGIEAITTDTPVPASCDTLQRLVLAKEAAENKQESLQRLVQRRHDAEREPPPELAEDIQSASRGEITAGECLVKLLSASPGADSPMTRYWARILCDAATTREDLPGVGKVLVCESLGNAHTSARKALRLIDFLENGPTMATGFHARPNRRITAP